MSRSHQTQSDYPAPTAVKDLRNFVEFASYFRKFVRNFARPPLPLIRLLKKTTALSEDDSEPRTFEDIKRAVLQPPILAHLDESATASVHTDATATGLGAALLQRVSSGEDRVLAYAKGVFDLTP